MDRVVDWKTEKLTLQGIEELEEMAVDFTGFEVTAKDLAVTLDLVSYETDYGSKTLRASVAMDCNYNPFLIVALEIIEWWKDENKEYRTILIGNNLICALRERKYRDSIWGMIYDALDAEHADVKTQRDA